MSSERKNYNAIDLTKFICSILVVMIHVDVSNYGSRNAIDILYSLIQKNVGILAVPFFFVTSGFLLFGNNSSDGIEIAKIKRYLKKIFRLYLIWSLIYLPLSFYDIVRFNRGMTVGKYIICYIRDFLLVGSYAQLWYLNALMIAVAIVSFFLYKKIKTRNIIAIASILFFIGLLGDSWFGVIVPLKTITPQIWELLKIVQLVIVTTRNGLFVGFFFVALGMMIAGHKRAVKMNKAVIAAIVSMLFLFMEIYLCKNSGLANGYNIYLFQAPTILFAFYIISNIELKECRAYKLMRMASSLIFYMHMWVYKIIYQIMKHLFGDGIKSPIIFVGTFIVTLLISLLIIRMSKYEKMKFLKVLYT